MALGNHGMVTVGQCLFCVRCCWWGCALGAGEVTSLLLHQQSKTWLEVMQPLLPIDWKKPAKNKSILNVGVWQM